jgi:adenylosuccinate synthase
MPCHVVLGGQWGDEGKGKIVDYLSADVQAVVRAQGGANAGHTLVIGGRKLALHQVPSGIGHPQCLGVLGNGMVVDPAALLEEIVALERLGLVVRERLRVSTSAHMVLPCHKLQDHLEERLRGTGAVGTTGRGIGPAYADKAARAGLQLGVFLRPAAEAGERLAETLRRKQAVLRGLDPGREFDVHAMTESVLACRDEIAPLLCDTQALLHDLCDAGSSILLEGAQGAMLDLDHGTYPFVTSSSCTSAGALVGSGIPPQQVSAVTAVVKAYATRVGNGPFPTEDRGPIGDRLRQIGQEYGATTGRPRRCGWFDAVAARWAARVSGFTQLAVTKLDVLDGFETIRMSAGYTLDGERINRLPVDAQSLQRCRPEYLEVEGWLESTTACRHAHDLPKNARRYLDLLQERVGVPVGLVSVGPERDSTFRM